MDVNVSRSSFSWATSACKAATAGMEGREGGAGAVRDTGSSVEEGAESTSRERGLAFARRDLSLAAGSSGGAMGFDGKDEAAGALKDTFLGGMATQKAIDLRRWRGMSAEGAAEAWEKGTQVVVKGREVDGTSVSNGSWERWKNTSRFIVDSYHYVNHRATDDLCRKWCNPAPMDGSAPNLVLVERDQRGNPYYKRAFNTQACEQLNAWLGGFEPMLKCMSAGNYNWFLHTLLFYHTREVIRKQEMKSRVNEGESDDDND
ncbi:hypothetical protein AX14_011504 [Amanita brunnescens Koide BX004]|nr:hypothetical protein AX14_011504 [Amanita brunnescens Koide BX004]